MFKAHHIGIFSLVLLSSCFNNTSRNHICDVPEYFMTERNHELNFDSVAVWHGSENRHWLLATAKSGQKIIVYDAATGAHIKDISSFGKELGQVDRPNGIAIADDLLFIAERDNGRMQIFSLPDGNPLGMTTGILERPYGIAVTPGGNGDYYAYVTDDLLTVNKNEPKSVHIYHVKLGENAVNIAHIGAFGDKEGSGRLKKVESIVIDPAHNRLLIADEHPDERNIKLYTLDGIFTGNILGAGLFKHDPEGIGMYETGPTSGYYIATDQDKKDNRFYLIDRETLAHVSTFASKGVHNTDGVAVTQKPFGPFSEGAFYAVHDDGNVCAYDWHSIVVTCGLKQD